jgi:arylsulfatase A-like enzyme
MAIIDRIRTGQIWLTRPNLSAILLFLLETGLLLSHRGSYLLSDGLRLPSKCLLAAAHLTLNLLLLNIAAMFFRHTSRIIRTAAILLLSAFTFYWIVSWFVFFGDGLFPGFQGIRFFTVSPLGLLLHMVQTSPVQLILAAHLSAIFPFILMRTIGRPQQNHVDIAPAQNNRAFRSLAASIRGSSILILTIASPALLWQSDVTRHMLAHQLSPQSSLIYSSFLNWGSELVSDDGPVQFAYAPIVAMSDYINQTSAAAPTAPVFVILVESLRSDVLDDNRVMPNIHKLIGESIYARNGVAGATHSDYEDPSILSSHYPLRSKTHHYYPEHITYPRVLIYDILKGAGYHTGFFSAQNESWGQMKNYLDTGGLDEFFDSTSADSDRYIRTEDPGFDRFIQKTKMAGKIEDKVMLEAAMSWLKKTHARSDENPDKIFALLNFQHPHFPYTWPADYKPPFDPGLLDFHIAFGNYPKSRIGQIKNRYWSSLAYVDEQIGLFLSFLKEQGLYDKSVIVITGDNGEGFYEHGVACHADLPFTELVGVPIIIKTPFGARLDTIRRYVAHIDIPPTITELLGLKSHPSFQGNSILRSDAEMADVPIFSITDIGLRQSGAVQLEGWKYLEDWNRKLSYLFNLNLDPLEEHNLYDPKDSKAAKLKAIFNLWKNEQIRYYSDFQFHSKFYPPKIRHKPMPPSESETKTSDHPDH